MTQIFTYNYILLFIFTQCTNMWWMFGSTFVYCITDEMTSNVYFSLSLSLFFFLKEKSTNFFKKSDCIKIIIINLNSKILFLNIFIMYMLVYDSKTGMYFNFMLKTARWIGKSITCHLMYL